MSKVTVAYVAMAVMLAEWSYRFVLHHRPPFLGTALLILAWHQLTWNSDRAQMLFNLGCAVSLPYKLAYDGIFLFGVMLPPFLWMILYAMEWVGAGLIAIAVVIDMGGGGGRIVRAHS